MVKKINDVDEHLILSQLANMVRDVRIRRGLTQKEFAKDLYVTDSYVSKLENGKSNIPVSSAIKMMLYCDIDSISELVHLESHDKFSTEQKKYYTKKRKVQDLLDKFDSTLDIESLDALEQIIKRIIK